MKPTPSVKKSSPEMRLLQRRQLDHRLANLPPLESPKLGWIRAIRESLGMTKVQLGRRLRIAPQSVQDLEAREQKETISVAKLREAAEAMECDLKIVFVPRTSLETTMREQAARKVREEKNRIIHTMRLEAQAEGVEEGLYLAAALETWLNSRARRLWD